MNETDRTGSVPIVGHRGCVERAPENTLEAFERAESFGVDAIELDVRSARDGELVVIHDATVDRTTSGHGAVGELSVAQLKQLEVDGGYKIPTLSEVLAYFSDTPLDPWIEVKEPGIVNNVVKAVAASDLAGSPVVFASKSFFDDVLNAMRGSAVRVGISVGPARMGQYPFDTTDPVSLAEQHDVDAVLVTPENITEELVTRCLGAGIQLGMVIDI